MMIPLIDDIIDNLADKKSPKEIEEAIIYFLRHLKPHMKAKDYEKLLKSVRHKINKYLNFGDW